MALGGAGCRAVGEEQNAVCDDKPTAASVAPPVDGFHMKANRSVDPVECGMGYSRALVYEPVDPTTPDILAALGRGLEATGWQSTECVTTKERCFRRGDWFVAATTPDAVADPNVPRAYPSPIGTGPRILAGLSEGLP